MGPAVRREFLRLRVQPRSKSGTAQEISRATKANHLVSRSLLAGSRMPMSSVFMQQHHWYELVKMVELISFVEFLSLSTSGLELRN